jgi:predicted nucleic acid-binding protein
LFGHGITAEDAALILVDTSVIVAWLDQDHGHHKACTAALDRASRTDELAISTVTYAELASGARTREHVDEQLSIFRRVPLDAESAWRAGVVFRQYRPAKGEHEPVLPDFFIRAQALVHSWPHLTNDRRRTKVWAGLDWIWP